MSDDLYGPITSRVDNLLYRYVRGVLATRELQRKADAAFVIAEEAWLAMSLEVQQEIINMSPEALEGMIQRVGKELCYSVSN